MQAPAEETEPSLYAVLNVSRDAAAEDIKRAYKSLAQVFHPDKHLDDDLRDKAQEAFSKLQEAYEVLSDPQKRDVYDVYGKEGLTAGLSVGTKLKSTEELRREWEAFKAQQQRAREEAMAHHRGIYVCRCAGGCGVRGVGCGVRRTGWSQLQALSALHRN
jgi:DnaJ family protein C protein 11